ncbi:MAG: glycerate kinase [Acidobacteriota bacterium]
MAEGSDGDDRLRSDARAILAAAVAAVEPEALVFEALERRGGSGPEDRADPSREGSARGETHIVAIGKAAPAMARGAHRSLGRRLSGGIVVGPGDLLADVGPEFLTFAGGHPVPNAEGRRGAEAIHALASRLGADDALYVLISGGGSALVTLPPPRVPLEDVRGTTRLLLRAGATIHELNAVRKHLDQLKGGRLARLAAPARVQAWVLSDVVGDPLDVIASGPVSPDPSLFRDVDAILKRYGLWSTLPDSVRRHLEAGLAGEVEESPGPGDPCFASVAASVLGNNRRAADAALREAERRGYGSVLLTTELVGEAREAGGFLAAVAREVRRSGQPIAAPACVLAAGETTVTVEGDGIGGRNQELALAAALALDGTPDVLVAGFGTDGIDGPTDAAGAFATGDSLTRARDLGLDAAHFLSRNDAYRFFQALDDLILTGPTGTNVMDLSLILVR